VDAPEAIDLHAGFDPEPDEVAVGTVVVENTARILFLFVPGCNKLLGLMRPDAEVRGYILSKGDAIQVRVCPEGTVLEPLRPDIIWAVPLDSLSTFRTNSTRIICQGRDAPTEVNRCYADQTRQGHAGIHVVARRDDHRVFNAGRSPNGVYGRTLMGSLRSWRTMGDTLFLIGPERPNQRGNPGERMHETWYLDMEGRGRSKSTAFGQLVTYPSYLRDPNHHEAARRLLHARALLDEQAATGEPTRTGVRRREARAHADWFARTPAPQPRAGTLLAQDWGHFQATSTAQPAVGAAANRQVMESQARSLAGKGLAGNPSRGRSPPGDPARVVATALAPTAPRTNPPPSAPRELFTIQGMINAAAAQHPEPADAGLFGTLPVAQPSAEVTAPHSAQGAELLSLYTGRPTGPPGLTVTATGLAPPASDSHLPATFPRFPKRRYVGGTDYGFEITGPPGRTLHFDEDEAKPIRTKMREGMLAAVRANRRPGPAQKHGMREIALHGNYLRELQKVDRVAAIDDLLYDALPSDEPWSRQAEAELSHLGDTGMVDLCADRTAPEYQRFLHWLAKRCSEGWCAAGELDGNPFCAEAGEFDLTPDEWSRRARDARITRE